MNFSGWLQENSLSAVHSSKKQETEKFTIFKNFIYQTDIKYYSFPTSLGLLWVNLLDLGKSFKDGAYFR